MPGKVEHREVAGVERAGKIADRHLKVAQVHVQQRPVAMHAVADLGQPGGHVGRVVHRVDQRVRGIIRIADHEGQTLGVGKPGQADQRDGDQKHGPNTGDEASR